MNMLERLKESGVDDETVRFFARIVLFSSRMSAYVYHCGPLSDYAVSSLGDIMKTLECDEFNNGLVRTAEQVTGERK